MKNSQKGFVVPLLLVVIALLVVGGGVYIYEIKKGEVKKNEVPVVVDTGIQQSNQIQYQTITSPKSEPKSSLVNEKVSGIIKSVYNKSGKNYIDVDYVEFNPNWAPGGVNGPVYQNSNSQIRTLEISSSAKFIVGSPAKNSIAFSDFQKYFTTSGTLVYQKNNPWEIVIENGVVTQVVEHYLP